VLISLHKLATTTPKVRAAIQQSNEPAWVLAGRFGTTEQTIYKWRHRGSVQDRSHTPHRLQTTRTSDRKAVSVLLHTSLLLLRVDLLAVVCGCLIPDVSRSGLDRCLRRNGVSNLRDLREKTPRPAHKPFKAYDRVSVHIDVEYLPHLLGECRRSPTACSGCTNGPPQAHRSSSAFAPTIRHCHTDQWRDMAHHRAPHRQCIPNLSVNVPVTCRSVN
jgi:hypothetical protein